MALNVKPAKLKGYGNYGKINAHLASGAPIPAVAKWVASYGLHADYMPGGGENIVRADVGQQWTGPQGLNATNLAFRSNTYSRITGKVSYEMPSQHNLKIWSEATVYPGSPYDEFGFVIAKPSLRDLTGSGPVLGWGVARILGEIPRRSWREPQAHVRARRAWAVFMGMGLWARRAKSADWRQRRPPAARCAVGLAALESRRAIPKGPKRSLGRRSSGWRGGGRTRGVFVG